jgi:hypothetical protein
MHDWEFGMEGYRELEECESDSLLYEDKTRQHYYATSRQHKNRSACVHCRTIER